MEQNFSLTPVHTDKQIQEISNLASVIWHEHFTPIIGIQQVEYMLEKFQSFHALKEQMETGYEYFQIFDNRVLRVLRDSSRRNYNVSKQTLFKKRGAKPTPLYKNDPVFKNSLSKTRSLFHLAYVQQIQYEYPCGLSSSWI